MSTPLRHAAPDGDAAHPTRSYHEAAMLGDKDQPTATRAWTNLPLKGWRGTVEAAAPIGALAERAVRGGLATSAILFAECVKPLELVASQFLRVMAPVAGLFAPAERREALAAALEERCGVDPGARSLSTGAFGRLIIEGRAAQGRSVP
jgi:hypothetical protein